MDNEYSKIGNNTNKLNNRLSLAGNHNATLGRFACYCYEIRVHLRSLEGDPDHDGEAVIRSDKFQEAKRLESEALKYG